MCSNFFLYIYSIFFLITQGVWVNLLSSYRLLSLTDSLAHFDDNNYSCFRALRLRYHQPCKLKVMSIKYQQYAFRTNLPCTKWINITLNRISIYLKLNMFLRVNLLTRFLAWLVSQQALKDKRLRLSMGMVPII